MTDLQLTIGIDAILSMQLRIYDPELTTHQGRAHGHRCFHNEEDLQILAPTLTSDASIIRLAQRWTGRLGGSSLGSQAWASLGSKTCIALSNFAQMKKEGSPG